MSKSNYNFRRITAKDALFLQIRNENKRLLEEFQLFLEDETRRNNPRFKVTGKAVSYKNYLVRLYIFIKEAMEPHSELILSDLQFMHKLHSLMSDKGFKKYNKDNKNFPSATIGAFKRFLNQIILIEDEIFDSVGKGLISNKNADDFVQVDSPRGKITIFTETFLRSQQVRKKALIDASFSCEIDNSHSTFTSRVTKQQFMESHHLIPVGHQDRFGNNLDVTANIVSLCPNCHRKIHHGEPEDIKEMLVKLHKNREDKLKFSDLYLEISELLELYLVE